MPFPFIIVIMLSSEYFCRFTYGEGDACAGQKVPMTRACLWFDLLPIWFPNQKSITAAVGTNQPGKDGHYKLIEGPSEETIPLIDSIDMSWEERRRMRYQHSEGR